jgi:hypothetical protein
MRPTDPDAKAAPGGTPSAAIDDFHELASPRVQSQLSAPFYQHLGRKVKRFRARLPRELRRGPRR